MIQFRQKQISAKILGTPVQSATEDLCKGVFYPSQHFSDRLRLTKPGYNKSKRETLTFGCARRLVPRESITSAGQYRYALDSQ